MTQKQQYIVDITGRSSDTVARLHEVVTQILGSVDQRTPVVSATPKPAVEEYAPSGWSVPHVALLLDGLTKAGRPVQRQALERGAQDGFISRAEIYAVGDYAPERRLNGWITPFNTMTEILKSEHGLPETAVAPVSPDYPETSSYSQAKGYMLAPEIRELLRSVAKLAIPAEAALHGDVVTFGTYVGWTVLFGERDRVVVRSVLDQEKEFTAPNLTLEVWRRRGPSFVVDTGSCTTDQSESFFSSERSRFGKFTSAVLYRGDGHYPGIILTDENGAQLALTQLNAGYRGTGPDATADILRAEGFDDEAIEALYDPARERVPVLVRP